MKVTDPPPAGGTGPLGPREMRTQVRTQLPQWDTPCSPEGENHKRLTFIEMYNFTSLKLKKIGLPSNLPNIQRSQTPLKCRIFHLFFLL